MIVLRRAADVDVELVAAGLERVLARGSRGEQGPDRLGNTIDTASILKIGSTCASASTRSRGSASASCVSVNAVTR